ncbi:MAG: NAD(P)/FAD-dependent oxidoreductase [Pseudomonadota bacterium]
MDDLTTEMNGWIRELATAVETADWNAAAALFGDPCYWRDLVLFSGTIVTVERNGIARALEDRMPGAGAAEWVLSGPARQVEDWVEAEFTVRTKRASGRGHVRLKDGKAWTFVTYQTELHDRPWAEGRNRPTGHRQGALPMRDHWADERRAETARLGHEDQPHVLVIGGGQAGMALGARLNALGLSNIVLEKRARAGDSWRDRYESLCLHDPVWYDHMPYIPFPAGWPVFTPKEKMADWLEMYARVMDLNYWTGTRAVSAVRDGDRWTVTVARAGAELVLRPRELVFATGMSGYPRVPEIAGADSFEGRQIHSTEYRSGKDHKGARAVVIGANTSAHDICHDLWEEGVPVTMIQRSSTLIARSANVVGNLLAPLYSEEALAAGISTEQADFLATTWPWAVMTDRVKPLAAKMQAQDADLHDRLRAAGFQLDNGWDGSGIPLKSARQGGGFYIDVGASDLIADGKIGLASGQPIDRIDPDAVVMEDGTRLPCDLIVYATGFGSMNQFVRDICGADVAEQVGQVWGLGSDTPKDPGPWEGELRNMWKPTAVDGLWFHGGNLAQSRHYSALLAMQLAARASI